MEKFRTYGRKLGHPRIAFYILIWLMVVLVGGTVAQKYIGLYEAQRAFFNSFIMWLGPVPLPGGYLTLSVLSLNLVAKLIFLSPWKKERIGSLISHAGVLLLLVGGMLTAAFSTEGNMVIYEGEASNFVTDYHIRELVVVENAAEGEKIISTYNWSDLKSGIKFSPPAVPFTIEVLRSCQNCEIFARKPEPENSGFMELRSRARDLDFRAMPLEKSDEINRYGISFRVKGASAEQDGVYISFDFIPAAPQVQVEGKSYSIVLRKQKRVLPFSVKLTKFHKEFHPPTDIAKTYRSDVVVNDGATEWNSVIQMNEPLHYKGYILYQASFVEEDGKQATVLAVVKNAGRMFPYLSGIMMCIGLLIHLVMQLPKLIAKRKVVEGK